MANYLENQLLPPIYKRCGKECYLDTVRKKLIFITPEETVRQKVVSYLVEDLKIPLDMIYIEESLSHYGINSKRRADIVIHKYNDKDNSIEPIAVIECKAPGVILGDNAAKQVIDYANDLLCDYIMLTDGESTACFKFDEENQNYIEIESLLQYSQMLEGKYVPLESEPVPPRAEFYELEQRLNEYRNYDIGIDTIQSKAVAITNLWECLLDCDHKMPTGKYDIFNLLEDYGIRALSYGNASGGSFSGSYRSFLVEVKGSTEFVSIGISPYITSEKKNIQKTTINVAIDNEKKAHHALQLVVDENMKVTEQTCSFYHHGRIAIGNLGSGKINELREHVYLRYPKIIYENKFYLGTLFNDRLWYMDDKDIIVLMENLISYALVRDEYRKVKSKH